MKLPPYRIEDLLPHAHPMILLDEVTTIGQGTLSAALTIRPGVPFFEAGRGVAAHVAIEWMAQTCGAYVGVTALEAGLYWTVTATDCATVLRPRLTPWVTA